MHTTTTPPVLPPPLPQAGPTQKVLLMNMTQAGRHLKFPKLDADGAPVRVRGVLQVETIILGSRDNRGRKGYIQPETTIEVALWQRLQNVKAIKGFVDRREIAAYSVNA